jgi:ATP-binding cassette subfamily B protein
MTRRDVRNHIGLVPQDPALFSSTVLDNIAFGQPEASRAEIEAAARQAQAHDFICQLPQGYDTPVGEKGVRLSGGQKQRLAIARAILRDPAILLLDEATSALDSVSEAAIQTALLSLMEGRTSLVVAHRLSTIIDADIILLMDKGSIVASGTHDALLVSSPLYQRLALHQFT